MAYRAGRFAGIDEKINTWLMIAGPVCSNGAIRSTTRKQKAAWFVTASSVRFSLGFGF
jgi:hypothetical protein